MFNVLNMPGYPCTNECEDRCANCKSVCERYKNFSPKEKEARREYKEKRDADAMLRGFFKHQINKSVYGK